MFGELASFGRQYCPWPMIVLDFSASLKAASERRNVIFTCCVSDHEQLVLLSLLLSSNDLPPEMMRDRTLARHEQLTPVLWRSLDPSEVLCPQAVARTLDQTTNNTRCKYGNNV